MERETDASGRCPHVNAGRDGPPGNKKRGGSANAWKCGLLCAPRRCPTLGGALDHVRPGAGNGGATCLWAGASSAGTGAPAELPRRGTFENRPAFFELE